MLYLGDPAGRHAQRRGLDRERENARPEHADDALPRRHDCIARDQRPTQPVALEFAKVGEHLLLARLRLGKSLLYAGARTTGCAGAWSGTAAAVHIASPY